MRRTLNVAYALIIDTDGNEGVFEALDQQLLGAPAAEPAEADTSPVWDRDTWGSTPEAQEQAIRAAELLGGVR